jgi:putative tryptophan/tyrosine transport system substrate-binding protein
MQLVASTRHLVLIIATTVAIGLASSWSEQSAGADQMMRERARIAVVADGSAEGAAISLKIFREHLAKLGYLEGHNLEIVERYTNGVQSRLPTMMREVADSNVDLIVTNATPAATAAKNATAKIPIVALGMADPVRAGLVASLARPGGNLTGLSMGFDEAFVEKWLELLQELIPRLKTVAVMSNPNNPMNRVLERDVVAAANKRALNIHVVYVAGPTDLERGFKEAHRTAQAAMVFGDAATLTDQIKVTQMAAKHRVPVMYGVGSFVENGGLISYAPDMPDMLRRTAEIVGMILQDARPGNLPVEQPRKFELHINLTAASDLGITIPESVLARADRVIR